MYNYNARPIERESVTFSSVLGERYYFFKIIILEVLFCRSCWLFLRKMLRLRSRDDVIHSVVVDLDVTCMSTMNMYHHTCMFVVIKHMASMYVYEDTRVEHPRMVLLKP